MKKKDFLVNGKTTPILIGVLHDTSVGPISYGISEQGLASVRFGLAEEDAATLEGGGPSLTAQQADLLGEISRQLAAYFSGQLKAFDVPIDWSVLTAFQRRALQAAAQIPYGEVKSYGQLAAEMGSPAGSRAVGSAMARNPMPIIVPCHRVVAANGQLTGYSASGGVHTKASLLRLEGHQVQDDRLIAGSLPLQMSLLG